MTITNNPEILTLDFIRYGLSAKACDDAQNMLDELDYKTVQEAWQKWQHGDHMLWVLQQLGMSEQQNLQFQLLMLETPCGDGRVVLNLVTDERLLHFVELKRKRVAGEVVSDTEWSYAATAVTAVTAAAYAAYADAAAAAWAADARQWQADKIRETIPNLQEWYDDLQAEDN